MAPSRRRRLALVAAGALVGPLVLACNALVGLNDYDRVECTGLVCDGGGVVPDTFVPPVDANKPDVVLIDAGGSAPVSWAAWPMPIREAEAGAKNAVSYLKTGEGIKDVVTGLVWRDPMKATAMSLDDAQNECVGIWRLPSRIELVTLLDHGQDVGAKIDSQFAGTPAIAHWTASVVRGLPADPPSGKRWVVDFSKGGVDQLPEQPGNAAAVRCVKKGPGQP